MTQIFKSGLTLCRIATNDQQTVVGFKLPKMKKLVKVAKGGQNDKAGQKRQNSLKYIILDPWPILGTPPLV